MNAVMKPRNFKAQGNKAVRTNVKKEEPVRLVMAYLTAREQLLTAASELGKNYFNTMTDTEYLPDPIKCDVDMMEAFNQGYAIQKLKVLGYSRYTISME